MATRATVLITIGIQFHRFKLVLVASFLAALVFVGIFSLAVLAGTDFSAGSAMKAACITSSRGQIDGLARPDRYLTYLDL